MTTTMATTTTAAQPPATPRYILRGHASPVHALQFFAQNSLLVSADADGWVIVWDVVTKRPRAVWKAHEGSVLEVKGFQLFTFDGDGNDEGVEGMEVFTHGRDHKLRVWRISSKDEGAMDRRLPVERTDKPPSSSATAQPWLVHSLPVNALNFCAFSLCFVPVDVSGQKLAEVEDASMNQTTKKKKKKKHPNDSVLLAVPNALNSGAIDIFHLPSERRVSTLPADDASSQTGMVMAVNIFFSSSLSSDDPPLYVVSGYEDGHVMVHVRRGVPLPPLSSDGNNNNRSETGRWQKLYSSRPHTQPVLSLDVPAGNKDYFITSSADALIAKHPIPTIPEIKPSSSSTNEAGSSPLKILNTKHAGQQGLRVRSDGKIFATAGWDARVRVYSCKTMKELAVLKWHKEGCYSVAFAEVVDGDGEEERGPEDNLPSDTIGDDLGLTTLPTGPLKAVQQQRSQKAQQTHWLAAGSKDGKISLWDIY